MDLSLVVLAATTLATSQPSLPSIELDGPRLPASRLAAAVTRPVGPAPAPRDTVIEYSKAYYQRLTIHRWGSYAMLPLFTAQYLVGRQLYDGNVEGNEDLHGAIALGLNLPSGMTSMAQLVVFGALIIFFLIVEPLGLARLWQIGKEKLRLWPFPH